MSVLNSTEVYSNGSRKAKTDRVVYMEKE